MKWHNTKYSGVRYREHPTRKHGLQKDKYFSLRYQADGERKEEGLGWTSQGWKAETAALTLADLKKAYVTGEGPSRLAEKRAIKKAREEATIKETRLREREAVTFRDYFNDKYLPQAEVDKKHHTIRREKSLFHSWINSEIGELPLIEISPFHLEKIKKNMHDAGQAPRSIQYMLAVVRQVFNHAKHIGLYIGDSPTTKVKRPSFDNRRMRFLTHYEAESLLDALKKKSMLVYETTLLSLRCGLRFGEIMYLTWGDVDIERGLLTIKDSKNTRTRAAYMTKDVKALLAKKVCGNPDSLVFQGRGGIKIERISKTFDRVVDKLKFNEGVSDPRQKVVFHSCRHSYASWLVESGVDLYVVQKLLGHSVIAMTERYAHLGENSLQAAVRTLEWSMRAKKPSKKVVELKERESA